MRVEVRDEVGTGARIPGDLRSQIEAALEVVPAHNLAGLGLILLRKSTDLGIRKSKQRIKTSRRGVGRSELLGYYQHGAKNRPAQIDLLVDNILDGWPRWVLFSSFVRETQVLPVLYHEIGHHIHATVSIPGNREKIADRFSKKFTSAYFKRRYRSWRWLLIAIRSLLRKYLALKAALSSRSR